MRSRLVLFHAITLLSISTWSQEIRIRVLDGRNGHPIRDHQINIWLHENDEHVTVWSDRHSVRQLLPSTDKQGTITLHIHPEENYITLFSANYPDCRKLTMGNGGLIDPAYSLAEISKSGVIVSNKCGKFTLTPNPGELLYFVRPWHWWESLLAAFKS